MTEKEAIDILCANVMVACDKAQLDDELTGYITENFGGVDQYIIGLIEAILYDLKK